MDELKDALQDFIDRRLAATDSEERKDAYRAVQWFLLDYELKAAAAHKKLAQ